MDCEVLICLKATLLKATLQVLSRGAPRTYTLVKTSPRHLVEPLTSVKDIFITLAERPTTSTTNVNNDLPQIPSI